MKNCGLIGLISLGFSIFCFGSNGTENQNAGIQGECKGGACKRNMQVPANMTEKESPSQKNELMEQPLMHTSGNGGTTLAELVKDKKGLLLDFYASWCGPCMRELPALIQKAEKLRPQGIEVVGINVDQNDGAKAEKLRQEKKIDFHWVIEGDDQFYSKQFDVQGIPRIVLLSQTGEVLFNGHPHDDKLVEALKKLGASL